MNKIYKDLVNLPGVSGYEHQVRNYIRNEFLKYSNNVRQDKLGSIYLVKEGPKDSPVVMIDAHMDEVGAIIVGITDRGMLQIKNMGGVQAEVFLSQNMDVVTKKGIIPGLIGSTPPHLGGQQKLDFNDLLIDIGASSKEEVLNMGIKIGDFVVPTNNYRITANGKRIISKAWDDRWGCGMILEILKETFYKEYPCTIVYSCTVQEEVGLRGAKTVVHSIKPDVFIALDSSPVNGSKFQDSTIGDLGKGFLYRIYDPNNIMLQGIQNHFLKVAKKYKIPYQIFFSKGGTNAAMALLQHEGILATTIGIPARYIHSTAAMIDIDDSKAIKKMLLKLLPTFTKETINEMKNK